MYKALYRKYRSQTFSEMVGQTVVSTSLKQAVATGKISHAYLFSGPRGTGKTSAAKIFAKAMNCPNQVDGEPCNNCPSCQDITRGSLEDVIEIDAASNNGVDEIRDIRDKSTYAPSRAIYKVYIIDEVHMLSTGAFNALLKTLEEPTTNVVFILATTELHKIPATILSRVQRFEFRTIKLSDIKGHLAWILENEAISYDEEALTMIARHAEGGMRDALSLLDQALSICGDGGLTSEIAQEMTGSLSLNSLHSYMTAILEQNVSQALEDLDKIFDSGKSMSRFATDLLYYLRDLLVVKVGGSPNLSYAHFSEYADLEHEQILTMIDTVTRALPDIKTGLNSKIYAEMMTVKLGSPTSSAITSSEWLDQIASLQEELDILKRAIEDLKTREVPTGSQVLASNPKSSSYNIDKAKILRIMSETMADSQQSRVYLDALKGAWNEILDSLTAQDRALLLGSEPVLANSENAILAFEAAFNAEQAMKRRDLNAIFGNIMSKVAGFAPNILAVPKREFNLIRSEFAKNRKTSSSQTINKEDDSSWLPEAFDFLRDKIERIED